MKTLMPNTTRIYHSPMTKVEVEVFRELFDAEYPYVHLEDVSDDVIEKFMNDRPELQGLVSIAKLLDLFKDYLLANQECGVTE